MVCYNPVKFDPCIFLILNVLQSINVVKAVVKYVDSGVVACNDLSIYYSMLPVVYIISYHRLHREHRLNTENNLCKSVLSVVNFLNNIFA